MNQEFLYPILLTEQDAVIAAIRRWCHQNVGQKGGGITLNHIRSCGFRVVNGSQAVKRADFVFCAKNCMVYLEAKIFIYKLWDRCLISTLLERESVTSKDNVFYLHVYLTEQFTLKSSIQWYHLNTAKIQNYWLAPRSTDPFILQRLIKWVSGYPEDLVVKSKLSPHSGSVALQQLNHIHKKDHEVFFEQVGQKMKAISLVLTIS